MFLGEIKEKKKGKIKLFLISLIWFYLFFSKELKFQKF